MSGILLDTSAYSAFMRGHPMAKRWIQESEDIHLTPVILGELKAGFKKGSREKGNLGALREFTQSPRVNVVDIDGETSDRYAIIQNALREAGTPIPTNDIWIAASCMQYGLRLVTTDGHFTRIPQILVECMTERDA